MVGCGEWAAEEAAGREGGVPICLLFHEATRNSWTSIDVTDNQKGIGINYGRIYGSSKGPRNEGWGASLGVVFRGLLQGLGEG